jgi:FkbM family methyltransferase
LKFCQAQCNACSTPDPFSTVRDLRTCYSPLSFFHYHQEFLFSSEDQQKRLGKLVEVTRDPVSIFMFNTYQFEYQRKSPIEQSAVAIFRALCSRRCRSHPAALVLDMGANDGFYAMLASSYGCRVISFEPQSGCIRPLAMAIALNRFVPAVDLRQRVVVANRSQSVMVPDLQCSGVAHYGNGRYGEAYDQNSTGLGTEVRVEAQVLEDVVCDGDELLLWHVDVEGLETVVLDSGAALITKKRAKNIILEWNPSRHLWNNVSITEWKKWGTIIDSAGYTCYDMNRGVPDSILIKDPHWATKDHDVFCSLEHSTDKFRLE